MTLDRRLTQRIREDMRSERDGIITPPRASMEQVNALRDQVKTLAEYLLEAHQPEIDAGHHGDDPRSCSYCKAIRKAGLTITRNR